MAWTRTKHLTNCPPSHGGDPPDADHPLPWILLDVRAYIADRQNSTTATIDLSNGCKIQFTFCIAPPPLVSYICAWSPNTNPAEFFAKEPAVGFVNANLIFLRVNSHQIYDFVYQASSRPSLKHIHNPYSPYNSYQYYLHIHNPNSPYNSYQYLCRIDNVAVLPDRRHAGADDDDDSGRFYVSALDRDRRFDLGHFKLCLYDDDKIDRLKWSHNILLLDQLRNPPDKDTVLHLTEKVLILDDEQPLVAFVDLWRGMVICNVLDNSTPGGSSYMPLPPELFNTQRTYNSFISRNIAIVNGRLTVVRLNLYVDPDDNDLCDWDLSTWSKPVTCLDNEWREDFMIESSDVSIDDSTRNVYLLPTLDGCPTTLMLELAHPTLSLMDAHIVYLLGKVDLSDEKAVVLTVDMANKRLLEVSVYDAERIVNDFDYAYTQSTISQYFTTAAAGVKRSLKRPLKFHMQYPHKRLDLHEPLQLDAGPGMGTKDETEDSDDPMDLE